MYKLCFLYIKILVVFSCIATFACQEMTTKFEKKTKNQNVVGNNMANDIVDNNSVSLFPEVLFVKSLYIAEPLKFTDDSSVHATELAIFYDNGEFGRVMALSGTYKGKKTIEIDTSEIVEYGKWEEKEKGEIKITIQKCRCEHCAENGPVNGFNEDDLKDPMPITETWKLKKGKFCEIGSLLGSKKKQFRFLNENEFVIESLKESVAETIKIKKDNSFAPCRNFDLEN